MTNLRIRPAVAALPRYVPSKTAPGAVKISSNEMPTPPSPAVLEAIARELETINRYPDLTAAPLREALAQRFGVGRRVLGSRRRIVEVQLFSHRNSRLHGHEVVTQYRDQWSQVKPSPYFFPTCGAVT